ncbi:pentatricopeptide repeat-containing protein At1g64100-like [Papaver somniferum]|uniref:pentatricopeptide repeat-containing protein At1g64100-like n=1 Tax=Papaver somniferum TaxID=3469 RepID=UPI000E6F566F|nr:pentatricopeptide repeat-containing protein At1g64100-like [Papaver somniferum]
MRNCCYGSGGYNRTRISVLERFIRDECKSGKIKKIDDGLVYFNHLILEKPLPSNDTFCHVLSSLSKIKCYSDVIVLYKKMNLIAVQPNIYTLSILINCYCQLGKVNHGFCLLGEIIKRGHHIDIVTYNTLIKGLCIKDEIEQAFELFAKVTQAGIQSNAFTCNTLIHGICRTGEVGLALQLKNNMVKRNCRPNVVSYCLILDTLCKRGLIDEALDLFSEMHRDSYVVPNVVVYSSLINGLCNSGWLNEAKRLFKEMASRGISANVPTYSCMIHGHCLHGQWKEARRYFDEMKDRGILPDTITFRVKDGANSGKKLFSCSNTMCSYFEWFDDAIKSIAPQYNGGCKSCVGDHKFSDCPWSQTRCINPKCNLRKVRILNIAQTSWNYDPTSTAVEEDGAVVLHFFWEPAVEEDGVVAAAFPFENGGTSAVAVFDADVVAVVGADKAFLIFFVVGFMRDARGLLELMEKINIKPNQMTYNSMIKGLCLSGRIQEANKLFDWMVDKGLETNDFTYNVLIDGCCKISRLDEAMQLFEKMKRNGLEPTTITYNTLLAGLYGDGRVNTTKYLFDEMQIFGLSLKV